MSHNQCEYNSKTTFWLAIVSIIGVLATCLLDFHSNELQKTQNNYSKEANAISRLTLEVKSLESKIETLKISLEKYSPQRNFKVPVSPPPNTKQAPSSSSTAFTPPERKPIKFPKFKKYYEMPKRKSGLTGFKIER